MLQLLIDTLFVFYSPFLVALTNFRSRNFHYEGGIILQRYFNITIEKPPNGNGPLERKCVYMTNHRSELDFVIDQVLTNGRSIFISRWLVAVFGFAFLPISFFTKSLFFFSRGKITREVLYQRLDTYWRASSYQSLLVYPEGTRNQTPTSKPLKSGFMYFAYERKLPVQIFISTNKDKIFSLQKKCSQHGMTMRVAYADPIYPEDFANADEFKTRAINVWHQTWKEAYEAADHAEPFKPKPFPTTISVWNRIGYHTSTLFLLAVYLGLCWRAPILLIYPLAGLLQS